LTSTSPASLYLLTHGFGPPEFHQSLSGPTRGKRLSNEFFANRVKFSNEEHCSKVEFFGRLAAAANACLREKPDATAHLVCAAVLRDAYAMAKQMNEGEFDFPIVAAGYQISDGLAFARPGTGFSSINETVEFFRRRCIHPHKEALGLGYKKRSGWAT
jgi:hypothetical protein